MDWMQQPPISAVAIANQQQQQHQHHLTTPVTQPQYQQQSKQLQQQQQLPQQRSAFIGKTALAQMPPPPTSLPSSALNNVNHLQNHMQQTTAEHYNMPTTPTQMSQFKNLLQQQSPQPQQSKTWQPQNYSQNINNIMQPTATSNANNWPQSPTNAPIQNQSTGYQQNANNWPHQQQAQQQQQQPTVYDNYFTPDQTSQSQHNQSLYQQNDLHSTNQQQQYNYNDFYDNGNSNANNNTNKTNDGWGDWGDWNENNNNGSNSGGLQQPPPMQEQPKSDIIDDSFKSQNNSTNDSWQWNLKENVASNLISQPQLPSQPIIVEQIIPQVPTSQQQLLTENITQASYVQQNTFAQLAQTNLTQQQKSADFAVVTSKTAKIASTMKPPNSLPLTTPSIESTENLLINNNLNVATSQNIPSLVYVSQAKPVSRPSRQFASPPTGNTPIESPEHSVLLPQPPQEFQNDALTQLQDESAMPNMTLPPPPPIVAATASNPFKRAGAVKHHRAELLATSSAANFAVPPPPADFANPLSTSMSHLEPDNSEILHENQEVIEPTVSLSSVPLSTERAPNISLPGGGGVLLNAERNQYMQTSHLSENQDDEINFEVDSLPPPGLSRLVLGEPELDLATQRLVTGTEEPSTLGNVGLATLNMEERHADGEDTSVEQMPNITPSLGGTANRATANIGADRNLYQVPGESVLNNDRRVVTGVETVETSTLSIGPQTTSSSQQVRSDQREVELDGENLEDDQPNSNIVAVASRNEPPLEGAAANGGSSVPSVSNDGVENRHIDKHQSKSSTARSQSNGSTGNDSELEQIEQQQPQHHSQRYNSGRNSSKHSDSERRTEKHRRDKQRSIERSFGSEEASLDYSTDQERDRRRNYREGSARSEHGNGERREKQRKREKRENLSGAERERERDRDKYYKSTGANVSSRNDYSRRSTRGHGGSRDVHRDRDYENSHRRSKQEKDSHRTERAEDGRDTRDPRDQRNQRERRGATRRGERDVRTDYNTIERQRRRAGDRIHARDYDDYRKQSSRNARDSDVEKEPQRYTRNGGGSNQMPADPRYDQHMMYGYPNSSQFDPYKYYYENMARTNPQAYHEWYKKYYEQQKQLMASMSASQQVTGTGVSTNENLSTHATVSAVNSPLAATADGRESVHSGRSSAHNEKDRYTQAYISQANQYHQRHYQQNAQFHHKQQQQQLQQQQQHHQLQRSLNAASYHSQNLVMNSTFLGDAASVASFSSYSRAGRLSAAHSVDNLSSVSSSAFKTISGHYAHGHGGSVKYASLDRYADSRSGHLSLRDGEANAVEQNRSTPLQFASLHTLVSMSSGIFVTIKPRMSSKGYLSNIAKLQRLGINDTTRQLYQSFPGPLVRGLTHKKTIIDFCEEQIRSGPRETSIFARQLTPRSVEKYRASYTLMWNLLILLLRQNGMVVGTDIAELLLKNQQQFPYQNDNITTSTHRRIHSISDDEESEHSLEAENKSDDVENADSAMSKTVDINNENNAGAEQKAIENSASATPPLIQLNEEEITDKFRNYLLYGNVNEALDWATDNNLWGHALFLASKVDRRSHANVMMKFANKLALNDPLQTLYQLMSGRTPSSVTSIQDEKWGDWRPHLSMILSNTSQKPDLDRKAITTLGDSLFNRGDLYAAHFCYLMAQVGFGRYQESAVHETSLQQNLPKLVLLGSSHYKNFRDFASNESIMMTEIYEYACSLNDEKFSLIEFQPYKYLLATRLLDYGLNLKSLMYMEQISLHIARDPSRYEASFINKVYEIADRLKYFDPVLEKTLDDQQQNLDGSSNTDVSTSLTQNFEEQKWLQTLRSIAAQYKLGYPVPTASYPSHDYIQQQEQQGQQQQDTNYLQDQINQEFSEINKQFSELNLQYNSNLNYYNAENVQQQQQSTLDHSEQSQDYSQYQAAAVPNQTIYGDYGIQLTTQEQQANVAGATAASTAEPYANYGAQQHQQSQHGSYYDPNSQQNYDAYGQQQENAAAGYGDYWAQQQQKIGDENARPTISMPKSKTYDSDDETQKKQQQAQQGLNQAKKGATASTQQNKADAKNTSKNTQQSNQNSGWFGGIWNKLSLKPKNQMILPDDKNPTIVWDVDKKRWVNTDGDEQVEESFKPPPKMNDITPQTQQQLPPQQQQQQQLGLQQQPQMQQLPQMSSHTHPQEQPQLPMAEFNQLQTMTTTSPLTSYSAQGPAGHNVAAAAAVTNTNVPKQPSLQSNMFKMQRNRTLKNAYVDVFNPSGAPMSKAAENVLAPALPPAAVPPSGYFIPDGSASNGNEVNAAYQQQQQQQQQQSETPQFYNPSKYGGGVGY